MLTRSQVENYQKLHKKEYSEELSYEEALESAIKLVELFRIIGRPIKKNDHKKFTEEMQDI